MTNKLDPLQKSMVDDFHRLLENSKQLHEMWHILSESDRQAVQNAYLEWAWQMIFAATSTKDMQDDVPENVQARIKQFGGFILTCQKGEPATFLTSDWVAMDRTQFDRIMESMKVEP